MELKRDVFYLAVAFLFLPHLLVAQAMPTAETFLTDEGDLRNEKIDSYFEVLGSSLLKEQIKISRGTRLFKIFG